MRIHMSREKKAQPRGGMRPLWLLSLFLILAASLLLLEGAKALVEKSEAPLMRDASVRAQAAFEAIKAERLLRGLPINATDDLNQTGMIGDAYTAITTTLGSLESKRSTTNPNLAAAVVEMFVALDLKPGDRVAVNFSGSFPGANIAVLCALDTLALKGVTITSVGASTYGANLPEFTFLDMEAHLAAQGLIARQSVAFSIGGEGDLGLDMPDAPREEIVARLTGLGYEYLAYADLDENIAERVRRFSEGGAVQCFVNVGGNLTSFGNDSGMTTAPGGILTSLPEGAQGNGLVQHYLREGVPVLHLLNMKGLMADYHLPYDPVPLPPAGEGALYFREGYRPWAVAVACAVDVAAVFCALAFGRGEKGKTSRKKEKGISCFQ